MDRYQRVEQPRPDTAIGPNEIRVTSQGMIRNYLTYASALLKGKKMGAIVLKAMGQAISKTVAIAEIIKVRIPGLHQDTAISSVSITDVWEPVEEGLLPLEMTRHVSMISITLSFEELDKNSPGYQAPLYVEQPKQPQQNQPQQQVQQQVRQQNQPPQQVQQQARQLQGQDTEDSYGRGRGQGRGRGRGRAWVQQGGYNGYDGYENYQDDGGWNPNWNQGGGRGRGGYAYRGMGYPRGAGVGYQRGAYMGYQRGGRMGYEYGPRMGYYDQGAGMGYQRGRGMGFERGRGSGGGFRGRGYARGRGNMGGHGRGNQF